MTETKTEILTDLTWRDLRVDDIVHTRYVMMFGDKRDNGGEAWGRVRELSFTAGPRLHWLEETDFEDHSLDTYHGFQITKVERKVPAVDAGKFGWATTAAGRHLGFTFKNPDSDLVYFTFVDEKYERKTYHEFSNFEPQEMEQ